MKAKKRNCNVNIKNYKATGQKNQKNQDLDVIMETEEDVKKDNTIAGETIQEKIKAAGKKDIDEGVGVTKFNARENLLQVLHHIAITDQSLYIQSMNTEEIWWEVKPIPSREQFKKEFKLCQEVTPAR
eukprot:14433826-Ditylum_brightwellii.AAC.1